MGILLTCDAWNWMSNLRAKKHYENARNNSNNILHHGATKTHWPLGFTAWRIYASLGLNELKTRWYRINTQNTVLYHKASLDMLNDITWSVSEIVSWNQWSLVTKQYLVWWQPTLAPPWKRASRNDRRLYIRYILGTWWNISNIVCHMTMC